jgi:hypothetical protein
MRNINDSSPEGAAPMAPRGINSQRRPRRGVLSWILFLALIGVSVWAYMLYRENETFKDPNAQVNEVIEQMRKHVILPENEVPGIFRITAEQLDEPFFKNAEEGDLLVAYQSTQQAFVYSPSRDILVNAGVLIINPTQDEVTPPPAQETQTDTSADVEVTE